MITIKFPILNRREKLRAALRHLETSDMAPAELADLCNEAAPGCTIDEMAAALRDVAAEHKVEADALIRFHDSRKLGA